MLVLKTSSVPAVLSLYRGQNNLSSAHSVLGLPVKMNESRYFCMVTAIVALTLLLPPAPPPEPPGPPEVELPEVEFPVETALVAVAAAEEVVVASEDEDEVSSV